MRAAIAILCAAALVAGCGDDDDETTAGETTPTTQADTATVPPELGAEPPEDEREDEREQEEPESEDEAPGAGRDDGAAQAPGGCGRVAFAQNTDSGASNIQAIGVDCRTARSVARGAADRAEDLSYELQGFSCNGARRDDRPLARVEWICLRGDGDDALVSFSTS